MNEAEKSSVDINQIILRIRWYVLVAVIGVCCFLYGGYVQKKIDRGESLAGLDQVAAMFNKAPENAATLVKNPDAIRQLDIEPERDLPDPVQNQLYVIGRDTIPIKKPFLYTTFDHENQEFIVLLRQLDSNELLHEWRIDYQILADEWKQIDTTACPCFEGPKPPSLPKLGLKAPLLLPNGDLVVDVYCHLCCFDSKSNLRWSLDRLCHHSVEVDAEGQIWTCSRKSDPLSEFFIDSIIRVDSTSGNVLYESTIEDIFLANPDYDLSHLNRRDQDPFHLNDVQPVQFTSKHWQPGDVFISLRNISTVLLYRPSTNEILWQNSTYWSYQHDVEILDDHTVTVFDNNIMAFPYPSVRFTNKHGRHNRTVAFDFERDEHRLLFAEIIQEFNANTTTEGRFKYFPNNHFAFWEITNSDYFLVHDTEQERSYQCVLPGMIAGKAGFLNWYRFVDKASLK